MKEYRNEFYWKEYDPKLFKTIVFINKNNDILEYIDRYGKKIDYICNEGNIEIPVKFKSIKLINKEKITKLPITYNIVTDAIDLDIFKKLDYLGFKIYYYNNQILENYKYVNQSLSENILKYTNRISIELSNLCNY